MLKCIDWNICNILQFSHSVNVHFKNLTEMGQFGNRISCAKEEICLNTEYSELMFPNTLISSMTPLA